VSWIRLVAPSDAEGRLAELYQQVAGPGGEVDAILQAQSLRPHTLSGHLSLYKSVLHHRGNTLGRATLELLGVFVSHWNGCEYCREHHFAGMRKDFRDEAQVVAVRQSLERGTWEEDFEARERELLRYAYKLTHRPAEMAETDLAPMREAGLTDGEILEANQVIAYFQYANRTVTGLGVSHEGETLGLAPTNLDDESDWAHR